MRGVGRVAKIGIKSNKTNAGGKEYKRKIQKMPK